MPGMNMTTQSPQLIERTKLRRFTERLTLPELLNILDGILETPGGILIMTLSNREVLHKGWCGRGAWT